MSVDVSVVVPTYNSLAQLRAVVSALEGQTGRVAWELIVVDDGSTDGTSEWLSSHRASVLIRTLCQPNAGPAQARNAGVAAARGDLVAFLGDDIVPSPSWLECHRSAHARRRGAPPIAVVGYTGWHHRLRLTPFLRYLNESGKQFGYGLIEDGESLPFTMFYSSNLSLRRELLLREPFDPSFRHAAWEDTELGFRLTQRYGLRLVYAPDAAAEHDHATSVRRFCARQELAGVAAVRFFDLHHELGPMLGLSAAGPIPLPWRGVHRARKLLASLLEPLPIALPRTWEAVLMGAYIAGLHRGWKATRGPGSGASAGDHRSTQA